jgi:hypothetical protein
MVSFSVVLSAAKDLAVIWSMNVVARDGWDRAAPAALMIQSYAPMRRWSDAVRPVTPDVFD